MRTASRAASAFLADPLAPRDFCDPLHLSHRLDDAREVIEVLHFDEERARGLAIGALELHRADVRARVSRGGGDVGVESPPIVAFEGESHEEPLAVGFLPVDLEAPLGL